MGTNTSTTETRYTFHLATELKSTLTLAHCLELDIMASAKNEEEALNELVKLVVAHLKYVLKHELPLYSPAPPDRWSKIQNQKGIILDVRVTFTTRKNTVTSARQNNRPFYKHREAELCLAP